MTGHTVAHAMNSPQHIVSKRHFSSTMSVAVQVLCKGVCYLTSTKPFLWQRPLIDYLLLISFVRNLVETSSCFRKRIHRRKIETLKILSMISFQIFSKHMNSKSISPIFEFCIVPATRGKYVHEISLIPRLGAQ